ncbi:MAG: hypothetical protein M3Y28_11280 [Armatimonadota bacterium]|nr:hypothetical protein [Armatimonadota bacterium]
MQQIAHEIIRDRQNAERDRENLLLRLENQLLRFERRLPPPKGDDDQDS